MSPAPLPVIWLLGKTGAGKSSLIRALTGLDAVTVGNGFKSCTRTAEAFDFPPGAPLMRFLDTRGLGEAAYDPAEDLRQCRDRSHALWVVARLDDPVQGEVAAALKAIRRAEPRMPAQLILTGADLIPPEDRAAAIETMRRIFGLAPLAVVALGPGADLTALHASLAETLPEVAFLMQAETGRSAEAAKFAEMRPRVLSWAAGAAASDLLPAAGLVTVPVAQVSMLAQLAQAYGITWDRRRMAEFAGLLGIGIAGSQGLRFALRQGLKLVPGIGQTLGAAVAGTASFAASYALGRVACRYLFDAAQGVTTSKEDLRAVYASALKGARDGRP